MERAVLTGLGFLLISASEKNICGILLPNFFTSIFPERHVVTNFVSASKTGKGSWRWKFDCVSVRPVLLWKIAYHWTLFSLMRRRRASKYRSWQGWASWWSLWATFSITVNYCFLCKTSWRGKRLFTTDEKYVDNNLEIGRARTTSMESKLGPRCRELVLELESATVISFLVRRLSAKKWRRAARKICLKVWPRHFFWVVCGCTTIYKTDYATRIC